LTDTFVGDCPKCGANMSQCGCDKTISADSEIPEPRFVNKKIKESRNQRLKNIAFSIEDELLDIIMDEYEDMGVKDIPSIGLALGVYSVTMQFTSQLQQHTLNMMIAAQGEAERLSTKWRYERK